jgi:hypothetical protein
LACRCEEGEATNLLYPTGERRMRVQKIEVPESTDPNKRYDPKQAEKAWKEFFDKFPDMSAWEITLKQTVRVWGLHRPAPEVAAQARGEFHFWAQRAWACISRAPIVEGYFLSSACVGDGALRSPSPCRFFRSY